MFAPELATRRRALARTALWGVGVGLVLAVGAEAGRVFVGSNFHEVLPGRVYRCSQPSAASLEQLIQRYGLRTIVNLRGSGAPQDWYLGECRAASHLGVNHEDICLSAGRLPATTEMRRLVEVLDRTEYPILLHCQRGADRTGLVSGVILLLYTDVSLKEGRRQLGLRYGHVAVGRPANLDRFFDLYAEWLEGLGLTHTSDLFRRWLLSAYRAGECHASLALIHRPDAIRLGEPFAFVVRAKNTAVKPWHLRPGANAGIHLSYAVFDPDDVCVYLDRAGLFEAQVQPGESIDFTLAVQSLVKPGRYRLLVDMIDEQQCNFHMTGSEPLEQEFDVGR
jgi:protein tyrosine phosphatase (PTP) superfamily phosphohydrolase (DUF442 family)